MIKSNAINSALNLKIHLLFCPKNVLSSKLKKEWKLRFFAVVHCNISNAFISYLEKYILLQFFYVFRAVVPFGELRKEVENTMID